MTDQHVTDQHVTDEHAPGIPPAPPAPGVLSRRAAVAGAGAAAVGIGLVAAGCSTGGGTDAPAAASTGTVLGPVSAVPVGSAALFGDQGVLVTQPTAGTFEGFSTTCPHQGCAVSKVQGASVVCTCHGSTFGLDGAVQQGPATRGLTPTKVSVTGDQLTIG